MKKYSPEITLIALGLIFAGLIIAFTLVERPTVTIVTGEESTSKTESKESYTQPSQNITEEITKSSQSQLPVNLNTATAQELCDNVPGVGETLACRIIEYRETYGNYSSVEELLIISGIGEQKLESIRQYITV